MNVTNWIYNDIGSKVVSARDVHLNEMRSGGWVWVQLYLIFYQVGMGIYFVNTRKKTRVLGMGMGRWTCTYYEVQKVV